MKRKVKILFFDIESSLMLVKVFGLRGNDYIDPNSIEQDWNVICAAWKWLGQKKVYATSVLENPKTKEITWDKNVVAKLCKAIEEADIIVAHNGDKFDIKKINTRRIKHKMGQMDIPVSVDTLKVAKKHFSFTSNKLDYLAKFLGVGEKLDTSKHLWEKALRGERKAIREMVKYNKVDVIVLERVYLELLPYITKHPKVNKILNIEETACENCGSTDLIKAGKRARADGTFQKHSCKDCGHLTLTKLPKRSMIKK